MGLYVVCLWAGAWKIDVGGLMCFLFVGRGLEDFLFIHLKSPWTAFHGSAVLRGIYKKTHPAQWAGLEDGSLYILY